MLGFLPGLGEWERRPWEPCRGGPSTRSQAQVGEAVLEVEAGPRLACRGTGQRTSSCGSTISASRSTMGGTRLAALSLASNPAKEDHVPGNPADVHHTARPQDWKVLKLPGEANVAKKTYI